MTEYDLMSKLDAIIYWQQKIYEAITAEEEDDEEILKGDKDKKKTRIEDD